MQPRGLAAGLPLSRKRRFGNAVTETDLEER